MKSKNIKPCPHCENGWVVFSSAWVMFKCGSCGGTGKK